VYCAVHFLLGGFHLGYHFLRVLSISNSIRHHLFLKGLFFGVPLGQQEFHHLLRLHFRRTAL
jgi:hypothetical protein